MRVLLIKTSSMGDIIHTLPALTDAKKAIPDFTVDWVVEESFAEIPSWHPAVRAVIPISFRRWRKNFFAKETRQAWHKMRDTLSAEQYDYVLDAQGLVKSALLTRYANGLKVGLDFKSAREAWASWFYQKKLTVNFYQHAIVRMRQLFQQAFAYELPDQAIDYGLQEVRQISAEKYVVFLHGTTWITKLWPEEYWKALATLAAASGYRIKISGGNDEEVARAERIAGVCDQVDVLPRLTISKMANLLRGANAAVAVDTGFGHLAAALNIPTVSIYGSTDPKFTGALGATSVHLHSSLACSPCLSRDCKFKGETQVKPACYQEITPEKVWQTVRNIF